MTTLCQQGKINFKNIENERLGGKRYFCRPFCKSVNGQV